MPGPTAAAGVVGVPFVGDGSNHRDSGRAARGWVGPTFKNPPEVLPSPREDVILIEHRTCGMNKLS
jgi:hypothetical protein